MIWYIVEKHGCMFVGDLYTQFGVIISYTCEFRSLTLALQLPETLDLQAVTLRPEVPWKCIFSRPLGSSRFSQPPLTVLLSFSAAHRPGQAEHSECHRQPRPVRHPGVRC